MRMIFALAGSCRRADIPACGDENKRGRGKELAYSVEAPSLSQTVCDFISTSISIVTHHATKDQSPVTYIRNKIRGPHHLCTLSAKKGYYLSQHPSSEG